MKTLLMLFFLTVNILCVTAQDIDYARRIVRTLASPEFAGRGYVDGGNTAASKYIGEQFTAIGLKPFGKDFFQPFKVDVNTFPSAMKLEIDGVELIPGEDYLVHPASPSISGDYAVHVVKKQDLLDDGKLRNAIQSSVGKILVIDESGFPSDEKDKLQKANELVNTLKYSPQATSVATIVYTTEKLLWSNATAQAPKPAFTVRKTMDIQNVKKVKLNVKAKMVNYKTRNIAAYIGGTAQPDSFLVVLAHYDHLGKMGAKTVFPGANDNASGVAMLLNLAKHFAAHPPKYSMAFIALSSEEIGILGAKYFTEHPLLKLSNIKFLINFDLAGTGDEGIKVVNGSVHEQAFDLLTKINSDNHYLASVQSRGAACNSDHCPFHNKGVPCFYIYTLGGTPAYHDIYDRAETLPLTAFEGYLKLMIAFFGKI